MKTFLLIDDHAVVRSGIKYLISEYYQPCLVDEAENEAQVLEKMQLATYDLIFLDVNIPNTNTSELLKLILKLKPETKVLMFSMNSEKMHAQRFIDLGAKGFLSKDAPIDEIKRAINLVLSNRKYYSQDLIETLIDKKTTEENGHPFAKLSEREFQIVNLLLEGKSLTEISNLLNIQRSTTGTHKAKIFEKLNVKNLIELLELSKIK